MVVVASGSGLTHAGILAGFHRLGANLRMIVICVRRDAAHQRLRIRTVLDNLDKVLTPAAQIPADRIEI